MRKIHQESSDGRSRVSKALNDSRGGGTKRHMHCKLNANTITCLCNSHFNLHHLKQARILAKDNGDPTSFTHGCLED